MNPYRTYHRIPDRLAHPDRRGRWLLALGITEGQLKTIPQSASKPPCICNIHFTDKFARQQRVQVPSRRLYVAERDTELSFKKEPEEEVDEFQTTEEWSHSATELGAEEVVESENVGRRSENIQNVLETLDKGVITFLPATPGSKRKSNEADLPENDLLGKKSRPHCPQPTHSVQIPNHQPERVHDYSKKPQNPPNQQQEFMSFPPPLPNYSFNMPPLYMNQGNFYLQNATQTSLDYHRRLIEQNFSRNCSNIPQIPSHYNPPTLPGFMSQFQRFHPGNPGRAPMLSALLSEPKESAPQINDELKIEIPAIKASLTETDQRHSHMEMGDPTANLETIQKVKEGFVLKLSLQVPIKYVHKKV